MAKRIGFKRSKVPHTCIPEVPKVQSDSPYSKLFLSYRTFLREVHQMTLKLILSSKVPQIYTGTKFQFALAIMAMAS